MGWLLVIVIVGGVLAFSFMSFTSKTKDSDMVTIATHVPENIADEAKELLRHHEISIYLADDPRNMPNVVFQGHVGGIRLQVPSSHSEEARSLLEEKMEYFKSS